jgi:hypothetical protein
MILSLAYLAGWSIIAGLMITDVPSNFVLAQAGRIWKNMGERKEDRGG